MRPEQYSWRMPGQFLPVDGVQLAYDIAGTGPTAVQLHGLSSSRAGDLELGLDLRGLADTGHRLIRYDARGHGASTGSREPGDYRWSVLAGDLLALLDALAPEEAVDAIGASMGVGTIIHAALRRPERFRRLALMVPPTAWETRAAQGSMYQQGADLIEAQGLDAFVAAMSAAPLPPVIAERVAARGVHPSPQLVPEVAAAVFRGAADTDLPPRDEIATLRMPVLILPWAADPGHPVSTSEQLRDLIPGAILLEPAEHAADVEEWPRRIAEFLA